MSLSNRLKQLEKDLPKEIITYTILDSEVVNGDIVKWICEREYKGITELVSSDQYNKDYDRSKEDSNIDFKLVLDKLSVQQLKDLIKD